MLKLSIFCITFIIIINHNVYYVLYQYIIIICKARVRHTALVYFYNMLLMVLRQY